MPRDFLILTNNNTELIRFAISKTIVIYGDFDEAKKDAGVNDEVFSAERLRTEFPAIYEEYKNQISKS